MAGSSSYSLSKEAFSQKWSPGDRWGRIKGTICRRETDGQGKALSSGFRWCFCRFRQQVSHHFVLQQTETKLFPTLCVVEHLAHNIGVLAGAFGLLFNLGRYLVGRHLGVELLAHFHEQQR